MSLLVIKKSRISTQDRGLKFVLPHVFVAPYITSPKLYTTMVYQTNDLMVSKLFILSLCLYQILLVHLHDTSDVWQKHKMASQKPI